MFYVYCGVAPPAAARLFESGGRHFSKFTVLGFLPSTADAFVIPRHGSVHLGLGDFFFVRFTTLDPYSLHTDSLMCREANDLCR
jgi:hypothetical protein